MTTRNDETSEDLLTLEEVALLVDGGDQVPRATARRLGPVIWTDPRFTRHVEIAEALARDAAIEPGSEHRLADSVTANEDLDHLLAAADWTDPAEVLDPTGERGILYPPLIHLARARVQRAEDPQPLEVALVKLQRAALFGELRQEIDRLNTGFEALDAPAAAQRLDSTLQQIDGLLRKFRQAAEELEP